MSYAYHLYMSLRMRYRLLRRRCFQNGTYNWRLAPAYDLTLCTKGYNGEHATSVNGKGQPTLSDFIAVGTKIRMNENRCRQIIAEVQEACKAIQRYEIK